LVGQQRLSWKRLEINISHYYAAASAFVFGVVALAHIARLLKRWKVQIGSLVVPMSVSWIGLVVAALLAFWGLVQSVQ
jgi:hypothetical protein